MTFITAEKKKITSKKELDAFMAAINKRISSVYHHELHKIGDIARNHENKNETESKLIDELFGCATSIVGDKRKHLQVLNNDENEYTMDKALDFIKKEYNHKLGKLLEENKDGISDDIMKAIKKAVFDEAEYKNYKEKKKEENAKKNDGMKEKNIDIEEKMEPEGDVSIDFEEVRNKLVRDAAEKKRKAEEWLAEAKDARGSFHDSKAYKNFVNKLKDFHDIAKMLNNMEKKNINSLNLQKSVKDSARRNKVRELLGMEKGKDIVSIEDVYARYEAIKKSVSNAAKAYVDYKLADHEIDHKKGSQKKALNADDVKKLNIMKKFCKDDNRLDKLPSNEEFKAGTKVKAAEGNHLVL